MNAIKNKCLLVGALFCVSSSYLVAQQDYQNFIRQVQLPFDGTKGATWDMPVESKGNKPSPLEINPGGARFELHTVSSKPLESFLLDTKYVSTYVPVAEVQIRTEDPYKTIPRTRADRPFYVDITMNGLRDGAKDPEASKKVKILRHVQSYGEKGDGTDIDRTQATLLNQGFLESNGKHTMTYLVNAIPNADRSKVRGEERFSVYSLADYQAPESQLDSLYVQVWPVAHGTVSGITNGDVIRLETPVLTVQARDIYPDSQIYLQAYPGEEKLGTEGVVIPGSGVVVNEAVPQDRLLTVKNWDEVLTQNGTWTIELLTSTPFGIDRLAWVSFNVDRTISVRTMMTTAE